MAKIKGALHAAKARTTRHGRLLFFFAIAAFIFPALQLTIVDSVRAKSAEAAKQQTYHAAPLEVEGQLPSLGKSADWLNSTPLTPAALRGKVVLVEFWTYSCINWRRQLPYVRAWSEKYKSQGLVVIGVHSPGFSFEKNLENIR
jgi:thiol-disulfide isomerase/thioredoxin